MCVPIENKFLSLPGNLFNLEMKHNLFYSIFILLVICIASCERNTSNLAEQVKQISDEVRHVYVPDKRVGVFDIGYEFSGNRLMLKGETTSNEAKQLLMKKLTDTGCEITDSIRILPDSGSLKGQIYGVVNLSVCNLHSAPDFSSEMVTQAVMGMPVRIIDYQNWYRIQTPDNYIAWVHRAGIQPMDKEKYNKWNAAGKVVITAHYGFAYEKPDNASQPVSDVVAGNRFVYEGSEGNYYKIGYPDGRKAFVSKLIAKEEKEWRKDIKQDAQNILRTAYTLMGVPYLWAGTSSKGMDCSGFVRNVLYMHDIIIPRDASQQIHVGTRMEINSDYSNLQPGDLLFFGRKATPEQKERVVHVAIYIGGERFIHAQGDVHIGSFNKNDSLFDEFNLNRLLFATRILDAIGSPGINTTIDNPYYRQVQ